MLCSYCGTGFESEQFWWNVFLELCQFHDISDLHLFISCHPPGQIKYLVPRTTPGCATAYVEQLETKFLRETENVFTLSLSIMMLTALVLPLLHFCERDSGGLFHCGVTTNFYLHPYYPYIHGRLARWRKWRACDVGEAKEGLEIELWPRWCNGRVGEWVVT